MRITIKLQIAGDDGTLLVEDDVLVLDKGHHHVEEIGLSLAETKDLLARLQKRLVSAQASCFITDHEYCPNCQRRLRKKGSYDTPSAHPSMM